MKELKNKIVLKDAICLSKFEFECLRSFTIDTKNDVYGKFDFKRNWTNRYTNQLQSHLQAQSLAFYTILSFSNKNLFIFLKT